MIIILEGIDGCGKSTVAQILSKRYANSVLIHAPSKLYEERINKATCIMERMALFIADMLRMIHEEIVPALAKGKTVILDRFYPSTLVYQSSDLSKFIAADTTELMKELGENMVAQFFGGVFFESVSKDVESPGDFVEARVFILDVDEDVARDRVLKRGGKLGDWEKADQETWALRRELYRQIPNVNMYFAKNYLIDANNKTPEQIAQEIVEIPC